MELKPGMKLNSTVSSVQIIVIRGRGEADIHCAGESMTTDEHSVPTSSRDEVDVQLGKRYTDESGSIELLCTKPGKGPLTVGNGTMTIKTAKALPASD